MEENNKIVVVKKKNPIWLIISVVLALAAAGAVAYAVYHKLSRKKKAKQNSADPLISEAEAPQECIPSETVEIPADSVISDMDTPDPKSVS